MASFFQCYGVWWVIFSIPFNINGPIVVTCSLTASRRNGTVIVVVVVVLVIIVVKVCRFSMTWPSETSLANILYREKLLSLMLPFLRSFFLFRNVGIRSFCIRPLPPLSIDESSSPKALVCWRLFSAELSKKRTSSRPENHDFSCSSLSSM